MSQEKRMILHIGLGSLKRKFLSRETLFENTSLATELGGNLPLQDGA